MNTTIHRENDRVWLEGIQGWFVGDKESSVHAAQEAVMQAVGEAIDYETLVGVSGLAFRMQVSTKGLCPSSPHPACGFNCLDRSNQAMPWAFQYHGPKLEETAEVAAARLAVVESIENRVPVQYGSEEDGVIVGYQKNGAEWLCLHPYKEGGKSIIVEKDWPWGVAVYTQRKEILADPHELALGALKQASEMAHTLECRGYFLGVKAWEMYLEKLAALQSAPESARQESLIGNAWIYECLIQFRRVAAGYLRRIAPAFPSTTAAGLEKAAGLYEQMANQVLCDETHCFTTIAPYPWMLKEGERWTAEKIVAQIERLNDALPLEIEAIHQLEQAL
jgi:hypothetical protein